MTILVPVKIFRLSPLQQSYIHTACNLYLENVVEYQITISYGLLINMRQFTAKTKEKTEYKAARTPFNTKIYKLKRIPENFMNSELARTAFLDIIRNIELCRETQNNMDELYESFCTNLIKEMNETFRLSIVLRKPGKDINNSNCTGTKI